MTFLCFLIFSAVITLAINLGGGRLEGFIDYPSVIAVTASVLLFVAASGRWAVFLRGMRHFFEFRHPMQIDRKVAIKIARFFRTLSFASLAIGGFWSIVGFIIMLGNLDPETIGSGLAVALLTLFYSFLLSLTVFFPISLYYTGMHDGKRHQKLRDGKHGNASRKENPHGNAN